MEKKKRMTVRYKNKDDKYYVIEAVNFIPRVAYMKDGCYRNRDGRAECFTETELFIFMAGNPSVNVVTVFGFVENEEKGAR